MKVGTDMNQCKHTKQRWQKLYQLSIIILASWACMLILAFSYNLTEPLAWYQTLMVCSHMWIQSRWDYLVSRELVVFGVRCGAHILYKCKKDLSSYTQWSSKQLCVSVSTCIKFITTGSRLTVAGSTLEDICIKLSFSQLSPLLWPEKTQ